MTDKTLENLRVQFRRAPFVAHLGIELESLSPGACETSLEVESRHLQQDGYVHAGVLAAIGDHSAGAAAYTLAEGGSTVLTVEFKLSLLRPARGELIRCRSNVLKAGRRFSFVESAIYCHASGEELLVAKASATIAVIPASDG